MGERRRGRAEFDGPLHKICVSVLDDPIELACRHVHQGAADRGNEICEARSKKAMNEWSRKDARTNPNAAS